MKEEILRDEYTGIEAQNDKQIAKDDQEYLLEGVMDDLGSEDISDFEVTFRGLDYDNMIILQKRPVLAFLKMVESWSKVAIDTYGKSLRLRSIDAATVELSYSNQPTYITVVLPNKSGKTIGTFYMRIEVLKRVVTQASNTLCLVEENNVLSIPLSTQLVMLETIKLHDYVYDLPVSGEEKSSGSVDVSTFTELINNFNTVTAFSELTQDKTVKVYPDGSTQVLSPAIRLDALSPFDLNTEYFEVPKAYIDSLSVIVASSVGVTYALYEESSRLYLNVYVGSHIHIVSQVARGTAKQSSKHLNLHTFATDWDAIKQLSKIVSTFDYYNPVLGLAVRNGELLAETNTIDLSTKNQLRFPVSDGAVDTPLLMFNSRIINSVLSQDLVVEQAGFTDNSIVICTRNSTIEVSANF